MAPCGDREPVRTGVGLWVVTGLVPSVIAPLLLLAVRGRLHVAPRRWPVGVVAAAFVLLHTGVTLSLLRPMSPVTWAGLHVLLLLGAVAYWLPVLSRPPRLVGVGPFVYLALSSPFLDFAGVAVVVLGSPAGGVAMILAMLPINTAAVVCLWRSMVNEERAMGTLGTVDP